MRQFQKILLVLFLFGGEAYSQHRDIFVHPVKGKDTNSGIVESEPVRSLKKASSLVSGPGDRILLAVDGLHKGILSLINISGEKENPIIVSSYGDTTPSMEGISDHAQIDIAGELCGILVENSSHIRIENISISGNGPVEGKIDPDMRVGILIRNTSTETSKNITIDNVKIANVFHGKPGMVRGATEVKTANGTQKYGWGIRLIAKEKSGGIENFVISNCMVSNVGHTGIKFTGENHNIRLGKVTGNTVLRTGGPGIQMSGVQFIHVKNNVVDSSGSSDDSRKWGRGSGLWTWSSSSVVIEHNRFLNASGPGDSAGAHIDFNCDNIVLQFNFSANNSGGFCEILGNNYNCVYRYNVSVNDGRRVKGQDGAFQEGKFFWLSGYQGQKKERKGPVNSYFYNNTLYADSSVIPKMAIDNTSDGILIMNNLFHFARPAVMVMGDQYRSDDGSGTLKRIVFVNNLYLRPDNWPAEASVQDTSPLVGDPLFLKAGGMEFKDYSPLNTELIYKGVHIPKLSGDAFGLPGGMDPLFENGIPILGSNYFIGAVAPIDHKKTSR